MRAALSVLALLVSLAALPAGAQDVAPAEAPAAPCPADPRAIPPILDPAWRHRQTLQVELSPYGGTWLGGTVGASWIAGLRATLHIVAPWAVQLDYGYSQWTGAPTDPSLHLISASLQVTHDVAMRVGEHLLEMDLYLTAGAGTIQVDRAWKAMGRLGGGVKVYTGLPWLAVRVDVDNYLHPIAGHINVDVSFSLGLSFLFPVDPSPLEGGPGP